MIATSVMKELNKSMAIIRTKMKDPINYFFSKCRQIRIKTAVLFTFNKKIGNGKLLFFVQWRIIISIIANGIFSNTKTLNKTSSEF